MNWSDRLAEFDGRPAQILIDESFKESAPLRELPRVAWFGVYCTRDPGTALWDPEESAELDALEDELIRLSGEFGRGWAVYVLRIATRGLREYYVYFGDSASLDRVLPSLRAAHPEYRVEYDEATDDSWSRYLSCLPGNRK